VHTRLIARAYGATGSIAFSIPGRPGGLADAGVTKLQNHLEVVLPAGDYRDDATLTTAANNALTLNVAVPDGVEAAAKNGNLTLTGTVRYGTERTAAEQAVTYLTGVRNVADYISISTDAVPST